MSQPVIKAFIEEVHTMQNQTDYIFFGAVETIKQYGKKMGYGKPKETAKKISFTTFDGMEVIFHKANRKDFWKFLGTYDFVYAIDENGSSVGPCSDPNLLFQLKSVI
jgi:hypothetical protein